MPKVTLGLKENQWHNLLVLAGWTGSPAGSMALGDLVQNEGEMWVLDDLVSNFKELSAEDFIEYVRDNVQENVDVNDTIADLDDAVSYWMGLMGDDCVGIDDGGEVVVFVPLR